MIGRWIDAQDDEVLRRLEAVPEDRWVMCEPVLDSNGNGCLLAHASPTGCWDFFDNTICVENRFDGLCDRFGDARIGHLISERASRVLEERNTSDSPIDTELVPVRVHVSLNCEPVEVGT